MGGRGSGSGMTARELVNSIRNSEPNGSGTTISLTVYPGGNKKSFRAPMGLFAL